MGTFIKSIAMALLFVVIVISTYKTVMACSDRGPGQEGCGSGENGCSGTCNSEGEGTCNSDDMKTLSSGLFACVDSSGTQNCRNSTIHKALCYTTWDCKCFGTSCGKDADTEDMHKDWIKQADPCPQG